MQKLPRLDAKDVQKELIEPAVKGTEAKWPNPEEWNWSKIEGFRLTCATDRHIQASYKILLQQCFDRNMLVRRQDDRDDLYNFIRKHMIHFFGGCYASGEQGAVGTFGYVWETCESYVLDKSGGGRVAGEASINRVVVTSSVAAVGPPMTYLEAGFGKRCHDRASSHIAPKLSRIHHGYVRYVDDM
jgi:hypothetical protein